MYPLTGLMLSTILMLSHGCHVLSLPALYHPVCRQNLAMSHDLSNLPFSLNTTLLEVYEDQTAPPGSQPGSDRAVGHAVVKFRLENLTQDPIIVKVCQVKVQAELGEQVFMTESVGDVGLGGLQIIERGFHLTQPQGFNQVMQVRAMITYQFDGHLYIAESSVVQVTVNR